MDKSNLLDQLWQASANEVGDFFRDWFHGKMIETALNVMDEEKRRLCGRRHGRHSDAPCRRAGSAKGRILVGGVAEAVVRPRVRRKRAGGGEEEVVLASYKAAQDPGAVRSALLRAMAAGTSTREAGKVFPGAPGGSSSSVSRLWAEEGRRLFDVLRQRILSGEAFFGLMLDGVVLAEGLTAVVALGLTVDGRKVVLDFEIGAEENHGTCDALLARLQQRNLAFAGKPLAVIDGSEAIAGPLRKRFPGVHVQRCLVHKERNLYRLLSKKLHGELADLFDLLRNAEGKEAGMKRLADIRNFAAKHSFEAVKSLDEAGDDLIRLHLLNAPSTLNKSLLSTNAIENIFRTTRLKLGRVTRWRGETDQPHRWLSYALGEAEKGFHRITGWRNIPEMLERLEWPPEAVADARRRQLEALQPVPLSRNRAGSRAHMRNPHACASH